MPAKKKKKAPARRAAGRPRSSTTGSAAKGKDAFRCPECGFVAKHAMGLGRHRSARHGALSKRAERRSVQVVSDGRWLSRQEAAVRAGVHYNTIRQWEQQGLIGTTKRSGRRGNLLSTEDLDRVVAQRGGAAIPAVAAASGAQSAALSRVVAQFATALEALLTELRAAGGTAAPKRRGRPPGSKNKPKPAETGPSRARAKAARKSPPVKRRTASRKGRRR